MIAISEYQRRMASLARAEAGRGGIRPVSSLASVALARRLEPHPRDRAGAVDPVAASIPDATPLLLRH